MEEYIEVVAYLRMARDITNDTVSKRDCRHAAYRQTIESISNIYRVTRGDYDYNGKGYINET